MPEHKKTRLVTGLVFIDNVQTDSNLPNNK